MMASESPQNGFVRWFASLPPARGSDLPPRGAIAVALIVLERLRDTYELDFESHLTERGGQIAGVSPRALQQILARYGIHRAFSGEGGRTNRGNHVVVRSMLDALRDSGLDRIGQAGRGRTIGQLQQLLVEHGVIPYLNRTKLRCSYRADQTVRAVIESILEAARERNQQAYVAQHLVGAKLAIRCRETPEVCVPLHAVSAADAQTSRAGDFRIGDTAIHVTTRPSEAVVQKCVDNLESGDAAFLVVPEDQLLAARQIASNFAASDRISVESLEAFLSQNIAELGAFSHAGLRSELRRLMEEYNRRVDHVEADKSLLIEIPRNLTV